MRNVYPVVLFPFDGEMYVVKGTSIVIYRNYSRGKYVVKIISRQLFIDGEDLTVEYILENYPEAVSEDFIFNLNLFR